jgi:hypothetical protein
LNQSSLGINISEEKKILIRLIDKLKKINVKLTEEKQCLENQLIIASNCIRNSKIKNSSKTDELYQISKISKLNSTISILKNELLKSYNSNSKQIKNTNHDRNKLKDSTLNEFNQVNFMKMDLSKSLSRLSELVH